MHWLNANINYLTVPLALVLSIFSFTVGLQQMRRRKAGLPPASVSRPAKALTYVLICVCCVLLGIALAHNFG
jgi:hypothetical protein